MVVLGSVFAEFQRWTRADLFWLASRQDDFAKFALDLSPIDPSRIPYVMPANDNLLTKDRLSPAAARCFVA